MQRLYAAAAQEIAEVREETPRCTPAEAAKGWMMAARFAIWRVWATDEAASRGIARQAGSCAFVDGLRSRLLQKAAGWKGDVCFQELYVAVQGGPGISVGRMPVRQSWEELAVGWMPSMQTRADAAWRHWCGNRAVLDCWMGRHGGARRRRAPGFGRRLRGDR